MSRWTRQDLDTVTNRLGRIVPAKNKFNARKKEVDGILFDSTHEAEVYQGLKLRQFANEITGLQCHVPLRVEINLIHVFSYECDFVFWDAVGKHYQDAKGYKKGAAYQLFRLKAKIIQAVLGITIEEV